MCIASACVRRVGSSCHRAGPRQPAPDQAPVPVARRRMTSGCCSCPCTASGRTSTLARATRMRWAWTARRATASTCRGPRRGAATTTTSPASSRCQPSPPPGRAFAPVCATQKVQSSASLAVRRASYFQGRVGRRRKGLGSPNALAPPFPGLVLGSSGVRGLLGDKAARGWIWICLHANGRRPSGSQAIGLGSDLFRDVRVATNLSRAFRCAFCDGVELRIPVRSRDFPLIRCQITCKCVPTGSRCRRCKV